jgi:hypothetical protein
LVDGSHLKGCFKNSTKKCILKGPKNSKLCQ